MNEDINKILDHLKAHKDDIELDEDQVIDIKKLMINQKYFGPGYWILMHTKAYKCKTLNDNQECLKFIYNVIDNITCSICKNHSNTYIKKNPPEEFLDYEIGIDGVDHYHGMFYYLFLFHNSVNKRIGKRVYTIEEIYKIYSKSE